MLKEKNKKKLVNEIINFSNELGIDDIGFISLNEIKNIKKIEYQKIKSLFPECKTIISACLSYNEKWNSINSKAEGYIARYATANFYKILSKKLNFLAKKILELINPKSSNKESFRIFVNSRINDKLIADASKLGFYSKNSCISINGRGQKFVLGEILLNLNLDLNLEKIEKKYNNECRSCKLCIDSCPTNAIKDFTLNKEICIQHLSSELNWPEKINEKKFIELWGTRFFGCSDCIDNCKMNHNQKNSCLKPDELIGFIGTTFNPENILTFKKTDYKNHFKNNQLTAGWIPVVALARNGLASLFNLNKINMIEKYFNAINNYNWNEEEIDYLKKFKNFYLKV